MARLKVAGVLAATGGALLVVSLLLVWWGYPSEFDDPAALPSAAQFTAEATTDSGVPLDADAFEFFDLRDIFWLATGIATFGFGLAILVTRRVHLAGGLIVGGMAVVTLLLVALTLISPPDFADLIPAEENPADLGVDLPLNPQAGGVVALVAALGCSIGAGLSIVGRRDTG